MTTRYISIDKMLTHVGQFGRFQWLLDAIFCCMAFPQTFQILIMYFAALNPSWNCVTNSTVCHFNGTLASDNDARCSLPRSSWEYTEPKEYSIVTQYDIYCGNEWQIYLSSSVLFFSWAIGAVFLGWVADNFGRKIVIFPSIGIIIIAGLITSFAPNIYWFVVFRIIVGFFIPGTYVQEFILISEIVGTKYRPAAGMIIWFAITMALCILGLKAYFIRQWKYLFIFCTIPYIFVFCFYKFVPESVRWFRLHGKMENVMELFRRIAWWNKTNVPEEVQIASGENSEGVHKPSPVNLFRTRAIAIQTLVQGYGWLVTGMVFYGLSLAADDLGGNIYRNFILVSATGFPASLVGMYLCEKIGRKKTVIINSFLGSITCVFIAFVPTSGNFIIVRITLGMLGKFFQTIAFNSLYTWSIEIFPTNVRAEGMGFLQFTSRMGAAGSPWIAKGLKSVHTKAPFIVMGISSLIGSFLFIVLPETRGKTILEFSSDAKVAVVQVEFSHDRHS